jgi:hypothetical protein
MHQRLLAEGSKGILLKENQSTNKIQLYFFVMVVVLLLLVLTAGGGGSLSRQSKSDMDCDIVSVDLLFVRAKE